MIDLLVKILINAIGVYVAVLVVPQISFPAADNLLKLEGNWWQVIVVALILAVINTYVKPIVKALSFPISMLTLGLVAFVINAALLLLVAGIDGATIKAGLVVGHFPPKLDVDTIVAAIVGALVLSIVSTLLGFVNFGRKLAGLR